VEAMGYIGPLDVDERIYGWIGNPRDEENNKPSIVNDHY